MASFFPQCLFLFLLFMVSISIQSASAQLQSFQAKAIDKATKPVSASSTSGPLSKLVRESYRRKLGSFRICALCTCCGGPKGLCLPSPCCYAINCNIPNRPFGYCSFTPKTCNCLGCHL
ncbi:uncharacterized protein LOC109824067 [Asparagus officinalis]|uniref:uncharacterized protein LOC109824067 n=1 Tax=Asparagus officinalis TaxID=4686 RepID=UPI00098E7423|nr:uncharacterized protein LOC109824067 [Asparagus officinalis]